MKREDLKKGAVTPKQFLFWFLVAGLVEVFQTISACEAGRITHNECANKVKRLYECMLIVASDEMPPKLREIFTLLNEGK